MNLGCNTAVYTIWLQIRIIDIARKEKGGHGNLLGELESPLKVRPLDTATQSAEFGYTM